MDKRLFIGGDNDGSVHIVENRPVIKLRSPDSPQIVETYLREFIHTPKETFSFYRHEKLQLESALARLFERYIRVPAQAE